MKAYLLTVWNKLSLFHKIAVVLLVLAVVLIPSKIAYDNYNSNAAAIKIKAGTLAQSKVSGAFANSAVPPAPPGASTSHSATASPSPSATVMIQVDIKGAVVTPGVYSIALPSRVNDAIKAAGGGTNKADLESINLAEMLFDGAMIFVPYIKDGDKPSDPGSSSAIVQGKSAVAKPEDFKAIININTATSAQLETLPGIGEAYAARIIEYRKHTPFKNIEDIKKVKGIGTATFDKLKSRIVVE